MLSMGQAARAAGISKTSIHRAIKSGKLSASRETDASYRIDPAELFRVYVPGRQVLEQTVTPSVTPATASFSPLAAHAPVAALGTSLTAAAAPVTGLGTLALEVEIRMLRELVQSERLRADAAACDRDAWRGQVEATQRLLVDARPRRSGLFARMFDRAARL